jgi:N-acetylneuraminic acid mutarotase
MQNIWLELPDLPTIGRGYAVAELLNDNKIYVIGGIAENTVTTYGLVEVFDPATETWLAEPVAPMPTPRGYMGSAVMNGRIYVFGSGAPAPDYYGLPTVEHFDGVSWTVVDTMPTHRYGASAGVVGDSIIYVSGGVLSWYANANVNEGYSEAAGWRTFAPMPVALHGHAVVEAGDVLYSFGGVSGDPVSGPILYKSVFVYHPPFVSSIHNPLAVNDLSVFPNPANDLLTIVNSGTSDGCLTLVQADGGGHCEAAPARQEPTADECGRCAAGLAFLEMDAGLRGELAGGQGDGGALNTENTTRYIFTISSPF